MLKMNNDQSPRIIMLKCKIIHTTLLATIAMTLSGCVVGRRTVDLEVPVSVISSEQKGTMKLLSVSDARDFQNKPSSPSTPSVDGDVDRMSLDEKSRMIGRQRNGYGMAMGDIALPAGVSIEEKAKKLIEEGLKERGYAMTVQGPSDYTVDVTVRKFWAWFTPGMFTISFEANLECEAEIVGQSRTEILRVVGYGRNVGQIASDANWQLAYQRAFEDFHQNLLKALDSKSF